MLMRGAVQWRGAFQRLGLTMGNLHWTAPSMADPQKGGRGTWPAAELHDSTIFGGAAASGRPTAPHLEQS